MEQSQKPDSISRYLLIAMSFSTTLIAAWALIENGYYLRSNINATFLAILSSALLAGADPKTPDEARREIQETSGKVKRLAKSLLSGNLSDMYKALKESNGSGPSIDNFIIGGTSFANAIIITVGLCKIIPALIARVSELL